MKKKSGKLRWGYSTGACAAAVAKAAWTNLLHGETPESIWLSFPDGRKRELPLLPDSSHMAAIRKDGGDDPDCTHGATVYASIRPCIQEEKRPEDYLLHSGDGLIILRGVEGIGLCTRQGLDCDCGHWAINSGPRRMIADNLHLAGLTSGCWLLEIGIEQGEELARHTLNAHLGITGGLSLLGTTGLVRPYSHESYIHTIRICVRSHRLSDGSSVVFCTGGRTRAGAMHHLKELPETAFINMGDFLAESLAVACNAGLKEIFVACMPGKLCKYASGFGNTHAKKASQNMELFRREVRNTLPGETQLHEELAQSPSIREALLRIPERACTPLLHRLAETALMHFAGRCAGNPRLHLLLFDFEGRFLFEETLTASEKTSSQSLMDAGRDVIPPAISEAVSPNKEENDGPVPDMTEETSSVMADTADMIGPFYFMKGHSHSEL